MCALIGFWARAQAWLRHVISALPADARAHAARARIPLRSRCVRCLPMGRHHFALRDVARANHLAPAGVLADYRATRRVVVGCVAFACALRQKEGSCGREARKTRGSVAAAIRAVRGITSLLTLVCSTEGLISSG